LPLLLIWTLLAAQPFSITNSDSQILTGKTLRILGGSLDNLDSQGAATTRDAGTGYYYDYDGNESCSDPGDGCYDIEGPYDYSPADSVYTYSLGVARVEQYVNASGGGASLLNRVPVEVTESAANAGKGDGTLICTTDLDKNPAAGASGALITHKAQVDPVALDASGADAERSAQLSLPS
jgi:hypothetical protein